MSSSSQNPVGYAVVSIHERGYGAIQTTGSSNTTCQKVALLAINITGITLLAVSGTGNGNVGSWVSGGIISLLAVAGDINLITGHRIIGECVGDCLES